MKKIFNTLGLFFLIILVFGIVMYIFNISNTFLDFGVNFLGDTPCKGDCHAPDEYHEWGFMHFILIFIELCLTVLYISFIFMVIEYLEKNYRKYFIF